MFRMIVVSQIIVKKLKINCYADEAKCFGKT